MKTFKEFLTEAKKDEVNEKFTKKFLRGNGQGQSGKILRYVFGLYDIEVTRDHLDGAVELRRRMIADPRFNKDELDRFGKEYPSLLAHGKASMELIDWLNPRNH